MLQSNDNADRFKLSEASKIKHVTFEDLKDWSDTANYRTVDQAVERLYTKLSLVILRSRDKGFPLTNSEKDLLSDVDQTFRSIFDAFQNRKREG
jgi:hypothetical protein